MTKIVYNACYGGFGLSDEATEMYFNLKGWKFEKYSNNFGISQYKINGEHFWDQDINRADPDLVQVVEALGEKANGFCAYLEIEELASGTLYRIREYDGYERIETADSVDWSVA